MRVRRSSPYFSFRRGHVVADHAQDQLRIRQQRLQTLDLGADFLELVLDLLALERGEASESHVEDRLRLDFGERELLHQVGARGLGRARGADGGDDLRRCCRARS